MKTGDRVRFGVDGGNTGTVRRLWTCAGTLIADVDFDNPQKIAYAFAWQPQPVNVSALELDA